MELALRLHEKARNVILPEVASDSLTFKKAVKQLRELFGEPKNHSNHVALRRTIPMDQEDWVEGLPR